MTIQLKVPDMACGACSDTITKAIIALDPQASVKADLNTKEISITTQASESEVKEAISAAGYNPSFE
ncbi:heavy metal transport/detoxification protein [Chondrocystis sp. NIES-4102]|nr:heavy metal transport/detoxification protein [Chondrocystis sp. NIES-4102]